MSKLPYSALVLAATIPAAHAADGEYRQAETVVVTANRVAQTADQALAPVTVVTREDIQELQPQSVSDVLRLQPGVSITQAGGPAGNTSVYLRGTGSDHALVLVDGVRVGSATLGGFDWRSIDPAQIERIEIVRGPRSSLYGSEAIGGVIQIFTRRPSGFTGHVEAGSNDTAIASVGFGGGRGPLRYSVTTSAQRTDGIDSLTTPSHEADADGYRDHSLSGRLNYALSESIELGLDAWYNESEIEYDDLFGFEDAYYDNTNAAASADFAQVLSDRWKHTLQLSYALDESIAHDTYAAEITTERTSADWQHELVLGDSQLLVAGVTWERTEGENVDPDTGTPTFSETLDSQAVYASWLGTFGLQDLEFSLRYDDHETFGGETTGSLAWGYQFRPDWRLVASYGTAFKAPTFNDLFYPGSGNPELDPETSETAELGLRWQANARNSFQAQLFYTEVDDLIAWTPIAPGSFFYTPENVDQARIRGLELIHDGAYGAWHWQANATFQQARDVIEDSRLAGRPDEKLALIIGRRIGPGHAQLDGVLVNHREDGGEDLAGYGLLNASASYPLSDGLRLTGRIENLTDTDYVLDAGYATEGRTYYLGLRYAPE